MDLKGKSGIYIIHNSLTKKVYIGSSSDLQDRKRHHIWNLKNNKHPNKHLQSAWNKYGEDRFDFYVLEYVKDKNKLLEVEQFHISLLMKYKPNMIYNISPTAGSPLGYRHSEEAKKMISLHSARVNLGTHLSKEVKNKLSLFNMGKKLSNETKAKIGEASRNRVFSEESKIKMRGENSHLSKLTEDIVIKIKIKILDRNVKLSNIAKEFGIGNSHIGRIKRGESWGWLKIPEECHKEGSYG